jgi:trehalose utilization protein
MKKRLFATLVLQLLAAMAIADPKAIRVLVWDEQQPEQNQAYENFLGNAIAQHLMQQPGFQVKSVSINSPEQGIDAATLDATDVIVWWGHKRHPDVNHGNVVALVDRIKNGKLSLISLHSAHWSQPFTEAMAERAKEDAMKQIPEAERATAVLNLVRPKPFAAPKRDDPLTPSLARGTEPNTWILKLPICCFPAWRADGAPSHVKTLQPDHPIAKGIPAEFDIPKTEMYDEPFHVPTPDAVVFEEHWDKGEHFRSGCVWQVGKGHVFYFRPGHEIYPIYTQPIPLKIIENAVRWMGAGRE